MPNTQNINDVIEAIKAHPKNFKMDRFIEGKDLHSCGTAGCIAGFTLALKTDILSMEPDFCSKLGSFHLKPNRIKEAADILGISVPEARTLFFMPGDDVQRELFDAHPPERRAEAAVRVLEMLRDIGHVNWSLALKEVGLHDVAEAPEREEDEDDDY